MTLQGNGEKKVLMSSSPRLSPNVSRDGGSSRLRPCTGWAVTDNGWKVLMTLAFASKCRINIWLFIEGFNAATQGQANKRSDSRTGLECKINRWGNKKQVERRSGTAHMRKTGWESDGLGRHWEQGGTHEFDEVCRKQWRRDHSLKNTHKGGQRDTT